MDKLSRRDFVPLMGSLMIGGSLLGSTYTYIPSIPIIDKIIPQRLAKGDWVSVIGPSGPIRDEKEVEEFVGILKDFGLKVKLGPNVKSKVGYFTAKDAERASELMAAVVDPDVKAIFTIRGGWGAARILELLDYSLIEQNPKIIIGFSDFTSILNAISVKTGLITFHGPSGNSTWNEYSSVYFKNLLFDSHLLHWSNRKEDAEIITFSPGTAQGEMFGGNLSVLSAMIGSNFLPNWENKILFLEEVAEEPYRIDRMLTHLKLAGVFDAVNGIILGGFRKCVPEEPDRSFSLEEVFEQHFSSIGKPVFFGAQIGHLRNKFTVPIGQRIEMNADNGQFNLLEPAVR